MERYKKVTLEAYEQYAEDYENRYSHHWSERDYEHISLGAFLGSLKGKRVLDLGCGPGRDGKMFCERGYDPVCVDIVPAMCARTRDKDLQAVRMDMEQLAFQAESFDGCWAYSSLLHVPRKKMSATLRGIYRALKPNAPFLASFVEGTGSEWRTNERWKGQVRYFSLWQIEEIIKKFECAGFVVIGVLRPRKPWFDLIAVRPEEK